jgi:ferritin-like metal-binding protein YciE
VLFTTPMLLDNFSDLFQRGLEYAWDCENLLLKHIPRMLDAASSPQLIQLLDACLARTKKHIAGLEQIFAELDRSPAAEKGEPIRIIFEECDRIIGHLEQSPLLDAALVFVMNQVEHYEIGLYGSLAGFARTLGSGMAARLEEMGNAERDVVSRLAELENSINRAAAGVHNAPPFALI